MNLESMWENEISNFPWVYVVNVVLLTYNPVWRNPT
jgi:hypothetical protein